MRCARCDHDLPNGDRYCGRCGLARSEDGIPRDPLLGVVVSERYRIEQRIGVGGMGTVYLATHTRIGQRVAVKVLHERYAGDRALTQRFENEALTYGRLAHPNLVTLHDYGRMPDGMFFMVLEYCPGIALSALLRHRKRLEWTLAVDIVLQIAQGLAVAHDAGIVHRDLKPENVILMEVRQGRYHVKLLDFGIAKAIDDEDGPRLTQAGMVFGTPEYMAPEQARGERVDARSDVYALGAMLYELLTGKPPFTGGNKMKVMHRQAAEVPIPPSAKLPEGALPKRLEDIVLKCLAKAPDARFPSAEVLIRACEEQLELDRVTPVPAVMTAPAPASPSPPQVVTRVVTPPPRQQVPALDLAPPPPGRAEPTLASSLGDSLLISDALPIVRDDAPSKQALGIAAALFVVAVTLAAVLFSAPTPPEPETTEAQAGTGAVAPSRPAPDAGAPLAEWPPLARPEPKRPPKPPVEKPPVEKPPVEKPPVEKPPVEKPPVEKPPIEKPPVEKPGAQRQALLEETKKVSEALRQGRLDEADTLLEKLQKKAPDAAELSRLKGDIREVRQHLALGKVAFEGSDCVGALSHLNAVLKVSPGHNEAAKMKKNCSEGLPPRHL